MSACLDGALELASLGWRIVPCRPPTGGAEQGRGKAPIVPSWPAAASTDATVIRRWWQQWPTANVGIAHGPQSGTVALDIDGAEGEASLADLVRQLGALPDTAEVATGRAVGGRHLIFRHPAGAPIRNAVGLVVGVDVRAEGGATVAPPSIHPDTGQPYRWLRHPSELHELPPLPARWVERLRQQASPAVGAAPGGQIPKGKRRSTLLSIAGAMRRQNAEEPEIVAALLTANTTRCAPPLPDREVRDLARDVPQRYAPTGKSPAEAKEKKEPPPPWKPLDTSLLGPLQRFVDEGAAAYGCEPVSIASPCLASHAAAIGLSRAAHPRPNWNEVCALWLPVLQGSGGMKSPPYRLATGPVLDFEGRARRDHDAAMEQYARELTRHKALLKTYKGNGEPPNAPREPAPKRFMVADTTIEKLARTLANNDRGCLVAREELSGLVKSFGEYKKAESGDVERWLALHDGAALIMDRVSLGAAPLFLPRALVSIAGCATPGSFSRAIGEDGRENGLAARLLPAMPPRRRRRWSEIAVSASAMEEYSLVLRRLAALEGLRGEDGWMAPVPIGLTEGAKDCFIPCFEEFSERDHDAADELERAILGKAAGHTLRFALVLHLAHDAARGTTSPEIEPETMARAIALAGWYIDEALRVQACLGMEPDEAAATTHRDRVEAWILERGGSVAARDMLGNGPRPRPDTADAAREFLDELVEAGKGTWCRPRQTGPGRPADPVFVLFASVAGSETEAREVAARDSDSASTSEEDAEREAWAERLALQGDYGRDYVDSASEGGRS